MKVSEVLRSARKVFVDKHYLFVCVAVEDCLATINAKNKTKRYIAELIHPHKSVIVWLRKEKNIDAYGGESNGAELATKYRTRWIDHMINELEKEGK
jgi:hypothetical protein